MEPSIQNKLQELEVKIDAIHASVEKTRRYFQIIFWVSVIAFVLPLIGLLIAIPSFLNSYVGAGLMDTDSMGIMEGL